MGPMRCRAWRDSAKVRMRGGRCSEELPRKGAEDLKRRAWERVERHGDEVNSCCEPYITKTRGLVFATYVRSAKPQPQPQPLAMAPQ